MNKITGTVGDRGANRREEVALVQHLLNMHVARLGLGKLIVDGQCGPKTIAAIKKLQLFLKMPTDGSLNPKSKAWDFLAGGGGAGGIRVPPVILPPLKTAPGAATDLSGAKWWHANQVKCPNENSLDVLQPPFKANIIAFIAALRKAGAKVDVNDTLRSKARGTLMQQCFDVKDGVDPKKLSPIPGLKINWDHGNPAATKKAAAEMVALFGIAVRPSTTSNHYIGHAVDMTIGWAGDLSIATPDGKKLVLIKSVPRTGGNADLHKVGALYGVYHKLPHDEPHWSITGR